MFDHLTQIAATQEKFSFEQEELSAFSSLEGPPAQLEHLPQGLIEDQL
ncbi:hypothetical protein KTQ42_23310 [Noviherbaspirillum sp. L7-7A]|jgi:hypothetical protein|nr:hypothetical protein [Noviherbaspirillum sp. L7-7A]MBV0882207.1 hypothetical protein [Noviherbaspirillum sp. L7-7A]